MVEYLALWLFVAVFVVLLSGYPVAFALSGTALIFAAGGIYFGVFDESFLDALPSRLFGIMDNQTLIAIPLFVFMGLMLEKARIAQDLLLAITSLFGNLRGGLAIAVCLVGMLMAASTGIVGATVVTMGLLSLPTMLQHGYKPEVACGTICASGTLGQIIPPSIALVLLGDVISNAYQQAQIASGVFSPETVSVGDLFAGALLPGLLLVALYLLLIIVRAHLQPNSMPPSQPLPCNFARLCQSLLAPLSLIFAVLGSIIFGLATPTEAASVGAFGAMVIALAKRQLSYETLRQTMQGTVQTTCMVFMILLGSALFSLVFRGFAGDELIASILSDLPGGKFGAVLLVMVVMFLLGFVLDFIEITFVVVPIVAPILLAMDISPVWLGVMIALNLQTSFLTPPFGFALFYLRGVAPKTISTVQIYQGVMPFIAVQLLMLAILGLYPSLATWLPSVIYPH